MFSGDDEVVFWGFDCGRLNACLFPGSGEALWPHEVIYSQGTILSKRDVLLIVSAIPGNALTWLTLPVLRAQSPLLSIELRADNSQQAS